VFIVRPDGTIAKIERGYAKDASAFLLAEVQSALGIQPIQPPAAYGGEIRRPKAGEGRSGVEVIPRAALAAVLVAGSAAGPAAANRPAPAATSIRIALEPLRAPALSAVLVAAVEEKLCADMAEATGAEVVCPGDIAAAAEAARQSAIHGECLTDECLRRVDAMK
jgi:hypothetical protein